MNMIQVKRTRLSWGHSICFPLLPRNELIRNGWAADYMFEQMGEKNTRTGPTEHGDQFHLARKSGGRFAFNLWLFNEAKNSFAMRAVDPYDTDISDILERISAR